MNVVPVHLTLITLTVPSIGYNIHNTQYLDRKENNKQTKKTRNYHNNFLVCNSRSVRPKQLSYVWQRLGNQFE